MNAIRFHRHGGPEVLLLEQVPVPVPGPGELLVRVEGAGVNFADTVRRWGDHYPIPTPLPAIGGGEIAGVVERVGEGVDAATWMGRRVLGTPAIGAYAQYALVPEPLAWCMPASLSAQQGLALLVQGLSAAFILQRSGQLLPGERVLVEGAAGGVGSIGVQLARLYGAGQVLGAASSASKRARVLALGADAAIDYTRPGWSEEVLHLTDGRGVDIIMEMTGGEVFAEAFKCLAPGGRIVVYGIASRQPYQVPSQLLIARGQAVVGFYLGRFLKDRALIESTLAQFSELITLGHLRLDAITMMPLAEAAEAHRQLESRQSTAKFVLVP